MHKNIYMLIAAFVFEEIKNGYAFTAFMCYYYCYFYYHSCLLIYLLILCFNVFCIHLGNDFSTNGRCHSIDLLAFFVISRYYNQNVLISK